MSISIVISTNYKHKKINKCISSIVDNDHFKYEIVIINQSSNSKLKNLAFYFKKNNINYFNSNEIGLSKGRNLGFTKIHGDIVVFTDDDCIVDKNWLKEIVKTFRKYPNISGVFGRTLPYQPEKHKSFICPSTFNNARIKTIDKPCKHWENIGFGNNMAFRREIFEKLGGFKEWLGSGSIGSSAEDAEFALRALIKGYKLLYNPKMIVYHNKWLNNRQLNKQNLSYRCGEMACYGYFAFCGHKFAKEVVSDNWKDSYWNFRLVIKKVLTGKWNEETFELMKQTFLLFSFRLRGYLVGKYFSILDPIKLD